MKKGFCLLVFGLTFLGLLLCCSAQAQTWKELLDQADSLSEAQNQDSAIVIGQVALERAEKEFGAQDSTVVLVLHRMGVYYYYQGNYGEAESLWERALAIKKKALGPDHPDVAKSLHNLAILYRGQGRFAEAEPLYKQALAIRKKALGPDHPDVANSLNSLAILYQDHGRYTEAEPLFKQALVIWRKALGPDHPDVAMILNNLAILYYDQGRYAEAEPLYKQALDIRKKALGPDHPEVAGHLNNLADFYRYEGRYAEAEPLFRQALAIWKKALGPHHPDVAMSLNNLALLCYDQSRYAEAEPLYKQALAILKEALGPDHPDVAKNIGNLAILYHSQGKYAEAEPLYKQAIVIWKKAFGPDHPHVAASVNNLATLYRDQGKYTEAEPLCKQALDIRKKALGADHPEVATSLNNLANLYRNQAKYREAESLYRRALDITERTLGLNHPYSAGVLHDIALFFKEKEEFDESKKSAGRAYNIRRQNFRDGSAVLSEKDALTYSKFMREEANQYISILLDSQDTSSSCLKEIAEVVFSTKGQVSDGIFARHRTQVYEKDPNLKALSDSLRYTRFKLANLYVQGLDEEDPEGYKEELLEVSKEKERLEAELARQSADFRRELELWEIDAEKVAGALPTKSILVEYMKFDRLKAKRETEPHYLLMILDNKGEVFVSDLGSSDEIDSIVTLYRSHFQEMSKRGGSPFSKDLEDYKRITAELYERIWKPVEDKLSNANLVFIAPDGALNLVSFGGLTDEAGKYLIESYPIQYLSSGRDLIRLKEAVEPGEGLFALGDPDFDASASDRLSSETVIAQAQEFDTSVYTLRNIRSGCEELSKITVLPLPGTRKEIERVSDVWKKESKGPCCVFFGTDASEENFKRNAPGNKVIHLATHGYYAQSQCVRELPQQKFKMTEFVGENPLLLSGLFLAGANLHGEGADSLGVEDGILTAEEVTSMDLEGIRWVVLSACESGLGEVKSGEGVYGLRRAFQMAGARTVISALWPVSDKTTAEMMSYLYGYEEDNLAFAMQSLAKKKLAELRKKNQPDHPYLWAPFIVLGDWR